MAHNLEARKHREAFTAFSELVEAEEPTLVAKWKAWVLEWERVQHTDGHGSPFESSKPGKPEGSTLLAPLDPNSSTAKSMKERRLELVRKELPRTAGDTEMEREHTPSVFITMGLDIEESQ
jgi:hypothetical protein